MTAFIFVPLLAITCVYAGALWTYVSHLFVGITEETAAGVDIVFTDDDPMIDWVLQGVHVGWLVGVWVVPALILGRVASANLEAPQRWYVIAAIGFGVFWLAFPLSLLSSMSAESRMAVFHAGLFARLVLRSGDVMVFYFLTALLLAVCIPLLPWLFTGHGYFPYFIASPILALALLLYARLMGRLACLARLTPVRARRKRKKPKRTKGVQVNDPWEVPAEVRAADEVRAGGFLQPRDLPPVDSPYEGEITGYDVRFDHGPTAESPEPELSEESLALAGGDGAVERTRESHLRQQKQDVSAIEPDRLEMDRANRLRDEKPPQRPWADANLWLLPLQPRASTAWVVLALGIGLLGVMVQGMVLLWPF